MSAPVCTIAVIVPVHNAAKYLPDCLDAIAAQQFDAFCCVLVDDGSRDESPLLCDNMAAGDARFTVIHQPQRGVSAARTAGLRRALEIGAEWIAFCDADDLFEDCREVSPFVARERSGHVFPDHKPRSDHVTCPSIRSVMFSHLLYDANLFHEQSAPCAGQSGAFPCNAQILAR